MEKNFKRVCLFTLPCALCAIIMRILMIENVIDPVSGFFYKGYIGWGIAMSVVIVLLCGLICAVGRLYYGNLPVSDDNRTLSVLYLILSIAVFYEGVIADSAKATIVWQALLLKLFGFAGAVVLVYFGICGLVKVKAKTTLSIIPLMFFAFRIMFSLSIYSYVPSIADNMFDLFATCTTAIYFLYFFKLICRVDRLKNKRWFLGVSALNFTACAIYGLPCALMVLTNQTNNLHLITPSFITDIVVMIFTAVMAVKYSKTVQPAPPKTVQVENFLYPENDTEE